MARTHGSGSDNDQFHRNTSVGIHAINGFTAFSSQKKKVATSRIQAGRKLTTNELTSLLGSLLGKPEIADVRYNNSAGELQLVLRKGTPLVQASTLERSLTDLLRRYH